MEDSQTLDHAAAYAGVFDEKIAAETTTNDSLNQLGNVDDLSTPMPEKCRAALQRALERNLDIFTCKNDRQALRVYTAMINDYTHPSCDQGGARLTCEEKGERSDSIFLSCCVINRRRIMYAELPKCSLLEAFYYTFGS